jgi:hypothetical protein
MLVKKYHYRAANHLLYMYSVPLQAGQKWPYLRNERTNTPEPYERCDGTLNIDRFQRQSPYFSRRLYIGFPTDTLCIYISYIFPLCSHTAYISFSQCSVYCCINMFPTDAHITNRNSHYVQQFISLFLSPFSKASYFRHHLYEK